MIDRDAMRGALTRRFAMVPAELEAVIDELEAAVKLDLNDPATENAVADAIVRFHGGAWLPLERRYPWRLQHLDPPPGRCPVTFDPSPELHYLCELRAGHAGMHEATVLPSELGEPNGLVEWIGR